MSTDQPTQNLPEYTDRITGHITEHPLRMGVLALALFTPLLDWVSVTIMGGGGQSIAGYTIISGKMFILFTLVLGTLELIGSDYRREAWMALGSILAILSVGSLLYINAEIEKMYAELGFWGGAVDASIGWGLYLAIATSLAIVVLGYTDH